MKSSFTLFGVTFRPYSLLTVAGAFACLGIFSLLTFRRHKNNTDENVFAIEMSIIAVAAGLPAALLFDSLFKMGETGKFQLRGATFYGSLICTLVVFPLLMLIKKKRTVPILHRFGDLAPAACIGHCLGRIGCFLGGCCFGCPTDCAFGVVFPEGSPAYELYGATAVHPTQLYEAAFLLALGVALLFVKNGFAFPLYLMGYGAWRFGIEFLRADDRGKIFSIPLSPAQIISLFLILLGIVVGSLILKEWIKKRKTVEIPNSNA